MSHVVDSSASEELTLQVRVQFVSTLFLLRLIIRAKDTG